MVDDYNSSYKKVLEAVTTKSDSVTCYGMIRSAESYYSNYDWLTDRLYSLDDLISEE